MPTSADSAAWSLVPSTILVLLGYALSSVHGVLQTLTPYLALRRSTGSGTLGHSNNSSLFLAPLHAVLRFGSVALAAGSIITLTFPAVKILTAGLYVPTENNKVRPIQATVETSIIDRLEALYDQSVPLQTVKEASDYVEWTTIPSFDVSQRAGVLDNLLFSNLTELMSENALQHNTGSIISLRIPAIAVNITCSSLGPDDFETVVTDQSFGNSTSFAFSSQCKTNACNTTMQAITEMYSLSPLRGLWTIDNSNSTSPRYQGYAAIGNDSILESRSAFDAPYFAILGDFASTNQTIVNQTFIGRYTTLEPESKKTFCVVHCPKTSTSIS